MGQYLRGDVLLAPVALDDRAGPKIRPVVVITTRSDGTIHVCPVSSKAPAGAPGLPITINDFASGGLDLFSESYVMTSRVITLRSGQVTGKKGRLLPESLAEIAGRVPAGPLHGMQKTRKTPGRSTRRENSRD